MYVSPQWELINPVAKCRGNLSKNDKERLDDCIQEMSRRNHASGGKCEVVGIY